MQGKSLIINRLSRMPAELLPPALLCAGVLAASGAFAAETSGHGDAAGSAGGFPQLDVATYPSQVFWLTVFFILLYYLMSKVALPRVAEVLDLRQSQRDSDLSRAEKLRKETEEVREAYEKAVQAAREEAQKVLGETEAELAELAAQRNAKFAEDARKRIVEAEKNIDAAKTEAMKSISDVAAEIAVDAAHKITSASITKAQAKKAVNAALKESK